MIKPCVDHLGNHYQSLGDMAMQYSMSLSTLSGRLHRGYSVRKALTTPVRETRRGTIYLDHLGNTFKSFRDMAEYYNINHIVLRRRLDGGMSLEDALLTPLSKTREGIPSVDHLGNRFKSVSALAKNYGISLCGLTLRLKRGMTLEEALTEPISATKRGVKCTDHLGIEYSSKCEMCKHYNISHQTLKGRLNLGWSLEKALTESVREHIRETV